MNSLLHKYESGVCDETWVYFKIVLGEYDPDFASDILKLPPNDFQRKGRIVQSSLTGRKRIQEYNSWCLKTDDIIHSPVLNDHLTCVLEYLKGKNSELKYLQNLEGVTMYIRCVWWSRCGEGGPTIEPSILQTLADMNIELHFSLMNLSFSFPDSNFTNEDDSI